MIDAGRLSERLTIQAATAAKDAIGGDADSWANAVTVWAEPVPLRGDERFQAQAIGAQTDYRFRIRLRADVTAKRRVRWTPRGLHGPSALTLEIHGAYPDPKDVRRFMLLDCGVYQ